MNAKQFKNIIKEAVREAVREELHSVLSDNQQPLQETKVFNFTSNDVMKGGLPENAINSLRTKMGIEFGLQQPYNNLQVQNNSENPYQAFLDDAANNMDARDISGLRNLG
jgi:hypothetical protein